MATLIFIVRSCLLVISFVIAVYFFFLPNTSGHPLISFAPMLVFVLFALVYLIDLKTICGVSVKEMTKEVDFDLVPSKGDCRFTAQIELNFKDGKLSSINLLPDTTRLSD